MANVVHYLQMNVPAEAVPGLMPFEVSADGSSLLLASERTAHVAFWGRRARRFKAFWSSGRTSAPAFVEILPQSSSGSQLVVEIQRPRERHARLLWRDAKVSAAALAVARAMRAEIEKKAASVSEPATATGSGR